MNKLVVHVLLAFGLFFAGVSAKAQEKQEKPERETSSSAAVRSEGTLLKVQVVFSEYGGEKKLKSLPYTLLIRAGDDYPQSKLRMGSKVPIPNGNSNPVNFQYVEIGTNIDCRTQPSLIEGKYKLSLTMERSWVEDDPSISGDKAHDSTGDTASGPIRPPIIRQFRTENAVTLRDGQSVETTFATEPVSGKVIKVEVTLNVLK